MFAALEGTAEKMPKDFHTWMVAFFVASLGVLQQYCLIGNILFRVKPTRQRSYLNREASLQISQSNTLQKEGTGGSGA